MLSINLIERLFESKRYDRLLESVAENGMGLPLVLRVRLSQSDTSAIALALRRLVDLTYGPTALAQRMANALIARQRPDGSFDSDPLVTATAIAALHQFTSSQADNAGPAEQTLARAMASLAAAQCNDGLFNSPSDRSDEDRALTAAFILFLLADDEAFRLSVCIADLLGWFEQHHDQLATHTGRLWRMARAEASPFAVLEVAVAA